MQKRNTIQKQIVERIATSRCDHPTAETIYLESKKELPNISLGTVYRILQELVKQGTIREVNIPQAPSRFDKTTSIHAHFVCKKCGQVTDIMIDNDDVLDYIQSKTDNKIDEASMCFSGICKDCEINDKNK